MQGDLFRKTAVLIGKNSIEGRLYSDVLSVNGFDVYITQSPMDALVKVRESETDLIVLDLEVAGSAFISRFLQNIRNEKTCELTVIIGMSIFSEEEQKNQLEGLDKCLTKPCSIDTFIGAVFDSIESRVHGCECIDNQ